MSLFLPGMRDYRFANRKALRNATTGAHLSRNISSGSRRVFTKSFWVKTPASFTDVGVYLSAAADFATRQDDITAWSDGLIRVQFNGFADGAAQSDALATDTWYHIVIQVNTPAASGADRLKIFVDGSDVTTLSVTPAQNYDTFWGLNTNVELAAYNGSSGDAWIFDEIASIDNSVVAPSSFRNGSTPVDLRSLTWGSDGYWLRFETGAAATVGNDSSGNGRHFTNNSFVDGDFSTMVP